MGWRNIVVLNMGLYVGFWLHTLFNTPYDWLLLGTALSIVAFIFPDEPLRRLVAMVRWVTKDGN